jgi:dTDP-4-amino-4,6-dideoxygalactose transaminase
LINTKKTYLPRKEKYAAYIDEIYDRGWITNRGSLVVRLQKQLEEYLGVTNVLLVANGTLALQIAYKLVGLKKEVITTPFSFVATTSSLVWQNITPVFSDIDKDTFNIDPDKIEENLNANTTGIVATHVFGNPCNFEQLSEIATNNNIKLIYDGAQAFDVKISGKSILSEGDITTLSFHATKIFHTIEGGALVIKDDNLYQTAKKMINFGFEREDTITELGINAKMNEFEAAMGLCMLEDVPNIIRKQKTISDIYQSELDGYVHFQKVDPSIDNNYNYFPILLENQSQLLHVQRIFKEHNIRLRRYFHPTLEKLPYINCEKEMVNSTDISNRILCLPIYHDLATNDLKFIIRLIKDNV